MVVVDVHYARSGDLRIAYAAFGEGPFDLIFVPGFVSHLENWWEARASARFFQRLASFSRLIMFDKRGTGLSDPMEGVPTLEQRMDDVRAVMESVGSERAALMGLSEGGPMSILFAATYPERTRALVLLGSAAKFLRSDDYPEGIPREELDAILDEIDTSWGQGGLMNVFLPSFADDERARQLWARYQRMGGSPGTARRLMEANALIDVRHALRAVQAPTLIVHRRDERAVRVGMARAMARELPHARYVEQEGDDHLPWLGDADGVLDEIEEFLTGHRHVYEPDRMLATVLFTDIVDSTSRAAELGDRGWHDLLAEHHQLAAREVENYRGRFVKTLGDGVLASFDGPARGVRCAEAIRDRSRVLGLDVRAGLHTGECELANGDMAGIAVHIGARVAASAGPGEVLVSSTVRDLVVGSGLRFADRGKHELKGVPGEWHLYAVGGP